MLLSDNFPKTLGAHNKSGKARASEMEHAIRWHIKVNMDKGPALYILFNEFYRKRGNKFIPPRVHQYASMMGLTIEEIAVLELKSRWASCSDKKRKVNFHWKVMMAPASVIDYLIVYELCHFNHKRHNAEFWNEVDKYYPEYQKQVAWLKVYGAALEV
jgi:predicted metal-dependent hydrolase